VGFQHEVGTASGRHSHNINHGERKKTLPRHKARKVESWILRGASASSRLQLEGGLTVIVRRETKTTRRKEKEKETAKTITKKKGEEEAGKGSKTY